MSICIIYVSGRNTLNSTIRPAKLKTTGNKIALGRIKEVTVIVTDINQAMREATFVILIFCPGSRKIPLDRRYKWSNAADPAKAAAMLRLGPS